MRRGFWFVIIAISIGFGASAAHAAVTQDAVPPKTTADLVALCTPRSGDPQADSATAYCYGFAEGAVEVVLSYSAVGPLSHRPFCLPSPPPQLSQVVSDFGAWANGEATNLQKPAMLGLVTYLVERFPCPRTGSTPHGGKR